MTDTATQAGKIQPRLKTKYRDEISKTLTEQSVFHEIDQDKIDRVRGMDITVVTTAKNDDEGRALLKALGFPFKSAESAN